MHANSDFRDGSDRHGVEFTSIGDVDILVSGPTDTATMRPSQGNESDLYLADETAWLESMAALIEKGSFDQLDFPHLQEYLTDMARRDRREVKSRLVALMAHLLKWNFQQERRSQSWISTVETQRQELMGLWESKSLRNHAASVLQAAYEDARRQAAIETELPLMTSPTECPYDLESIERGDWIS